MAGLDHRDKKTITEKRKIGNPDSGYRNRSRFFAILLAQEGYQVTAIDCTAEMLAEAQANAGALAAQITWKLMDAQKLEFADEV